MKNFFMNKHKKPVNERVIKPLTTLLGGRKLIDLAVELGVTQTKLSEIMALRMAAGLNIFSELCVKSSVFPEYLLLGSGPMFRGALPSLSTPTEEISGDVVSVRTYEAKVEECALLNNRLNVMRKRGRALSGITSPVDVKISCYNNIYIIKSQ